MTLEAFALATFDEGESRSSIMKAIENTRLLSDATRTLGFPEARLLVHGVGLIRNQYRNELRTLILGNKAVLQIETEEPVDGSEVGPVRDLVLELLGEDANQYIDRASVLAVDHGYLQVRPGDTVFGSHQGSVGPSVSWGGTRQGFLTAGHVAQLTGGPVSDQSGSLLGSVVWTNDPTLNPSNMKDVDTALIESYPQISLHGSGQPTSIAGAGDHLSIVSNGKNANVLAFCDYVQLGSPVATFGDVYLTDRAATAPGDSGGLVENSSGDIIGSVIGAYNGRQMSVIQSIGYQLREIRSRSGHMVRV